MGAVTAGSQVRNGRQVPRVTIMSGQMTPIEMFCDILDKEKCKILLSSTTRPKMCGRQRVV